MLAGELSFDIFLLCLISFRQREKRKLLPVEEQARLRVRALAAVQKSKHKKAFMKRAEEEAKASRKEWKVAREEEKEEEEEED